MEAAKYLFIFAVAAISILALTSGAKNGMNDAANSSQTCSKILDDFWRAQCYIDVAKIKAKQESEVK